MNESYFKKYRDNIVGIDHTFQTPYGKKPLIYADWVASGRLYEPIERRLQEKIYPLVGNTHTDTNVTGGSMSLAYKKAQLIIKKHVGANDNDVIISSGSGMTRVVNKFQRILGLKIHESLKNKLTISEKDKPVVFITHMEHHSNQTSWLESLAIVEMIQPDEDGLPDLNHFAKLLDKYQHHSRLYAAVTSCSNATGVFCPYPKIAQMIHKVGGYCFVDFACSAPYEDINMHPDDPSQSLDAVFFSPHKFLGGPGTTGVLVFNKKLYVNHIPDQPGGGTVDWTNPWGEHKYIDDIEAREDGGTPAFLQTIKSALCIQLKEEMGTDNMLKREKEILNKVWAEFEKIPGLRILAHNIKDRLGVVSFYIDDLHFNLAVAILNDRYGIQVRGGCFCAGTYGHYLLKVDKHHSSQITDRINEGDFSLKPGWIRLSLHPTMSDDEVNIICDSVKDLAENFPEYSKDYKTDKTSGLFYHKDSEVYHMKHQIVDWFEKPLKE